MKKAPVILLVVILLLLASGCKSPTLAPQGPTEPVENKSISIRIGISPTGVTQGESFEYEAFLFYSAEIGNEDYLEGEFNSAEITINAVPMVCINEELFRINSGMGLFLSTGDEVSVTISHEKTGLIQKTLTVPEPISSFTLTPELTPGEKNTHDEFTMSWVSGPSSGYTSQVRRFDDTNTPLSSFSRNDASPTSTSTWSSEVISFELTAPAPYLEFSLRSSDTITIDTLGPNSKIYVDSPISAVISNH